MSKYKIIKDREELDKFIKWLPDLQPYQKFYVALFARKKYDDALKSTASDKMQLKRILANKENLVDKIKKLEIDLDLYKLKNVPATQQSLAIYITPNPRDMIKAHNDVLMRVAKAITTQNYFYNLHSETMSSIQRSKAYNYVVDFDIDSKDIDLSKLKDIVMPTDYKVLETRGGYHILVYPRNATDHSKQYNKMYKENDDRRFPLDWHRRITTVYNVDQSGDQLIPIPGCTQGNFIPKFIDI